MTSAPGLFPFLVKRFPIDRLKIDRSFIRDIPQDANSVEIASAIIGMGRSLSLEVVAEGVQTDEQAALLRDHGCDFFQGRLLLRAAARG